MNLCLPKKWREKTVQTTAWWMRLVELLNDWKVYGIENGKRFINKWKDFICWWMPLWLQPHDLPSTSTICRLSDARKPNTWKMFKVRHKHLASLFTIHCLLCYCTRHISVTHTSKWRKCLVRRIKMGIRMSTTNDNFTPMKKDNLMLIVTISH